MMVNEAPITMPAPIFPSPEIAPNAAPIAMPATIIQPTWVSFNLVLLVIKFICLLICRYFLAQNLDNAVVRDLGYHHLGSTLCVEKRNERGATVCVHKLNDDRINVLVVRGDAVVSEDPAGVFIFINRGVDSLFI